MYDQATKGETHTWQAGKKASAVFVLVLSSCSHMVKKQGKQLPFGASAQLVTDTAFLSVY